VQAGNWAEVERALASNYVGVTPSGALDRAATIEQYRTWQLKDCVIGDLKTELNGNHHRGDLFDYSEWRLQWNRRLATAPVCAAAYDDRLATAEIGMGRDCAQRQPTIDAHSIAIPAETLLAASPMPLTGKNLPAFRRSLLHWYDQNRRDLPWRRSRDPYRIWLSEIMLQQTRVAAVLDHYRIFLERFPNVQSLAAAF